MIQLQPALMRRPKVVGILFAFILSLMLMTGCDRTGKGSTSSELFGARIDTITVRDTVTVRDTITMRDTVTVRDTVVVVDTVFVEKEVVKKIEVPAEIPAYYEAAWNRQVAELSANLADDKMCFSGLDSVKVVVVMNEDAKDIFSEQRTKDKFELTLRRHGVPLSDLSNPYLSLSFQALWNEDKTLAAYVVELTLIELIIFYRNNKPHKRFVTLWQDMSYGYAGSKVARQSALEAIEEKAERVANLYLSAN